MNKTYFKHRTMAHQEGSLEALATCPIGVDIGLARRTGQIFVESNHSGTPHLALVKVQKVLKNWQVEADNIAVARPKFSGTLSRTKRDCVGHINTKSASSSKYSKYVRL